MAQKIDPLKKNAKALQRKIDLLQKDLDVLATDDEANWALKGNDKKTITKNHKLREKTLKSLLSLVAQLEKQHRLIDQT